MYRLSPWARYVVQPPREEGFVYKQKTWHPAVPYEMKYPRVKKPESLRIYECHVGIATSEQRVGTYKEFAKNVIPRIVRQGTKLFFFSEEEQYVAVVSTFLSSGPRRLTPKLCVMSDV